MTNREPRPFEWRGYRSYEALRADFLEKFSRLTADDLTTGGRFACLLEAIQVHLIFWATTAVQVG